MSSTVQLDREAVLRVFAEAKDQSDYMIALYKMVFPRWDDIISIEQWPKCNKDTWTWICRLAMDFDQTHHGSLPGGCWLNKGFSGSDGENLQFLEIDTSKCVIEYKIVD